MAAVTMCSDFGVHKIKSVTVSTLPPSICHEVIGLNAMIIDGETVETGADFIFLVSKTLRMVIPAMRLKDAYSLEGKL